MPLPSRNDLQIQLRLALHPPDDFVAVARLAQGTGRHRAHPRVITAAQGSIAPQGGPLGARTLYHYQNGVYTLYTIYSTSDPEVIGTDITSGCTGLLKSGHDRPLCTNADQDEGGRPAGIANGANPRSRRRRCGQRKEQGRSLGRSDCGGWRSLVVCLHHAASTSAA